MEGAERALLGQGGAPAQIANAVQLELDVVEFLPRLGHPFVELDIDHRDVGARDRLELGDPGVFRHLLFDLLRHQLLDFLGTDPRPGVIATATRTGISGSLRWGIL